MMKIAVCDDEPMALDTLADKIHSYMNTTHMNFTVSKFTDGESLLSSITKRGNHFDAIYLDIKMNQLNGIDTAKSIRKTNSDTFIIFVTALKEYVFDAFDVDATNFLVKPIEETKLFSTLDKITLQLCELENKTLLIATSGNLKKVPFEKIAYCEVLNHRIFIYEKECMHEYAGKIDELEKSLDGDFFRCHRSYMINLRFVESYIEGLACLTSGEKIPVATRRRQEFMQALLRIQRKEVR